MHAKNVVLSAECDTDACLGSLLLALEKWLWLGMQGVQGLPPGEIHWQMILLGQGSGHLQACVYLHLFGASISRGWEMRIDA